MEKNRKYWEKIDEDNETYAPNSYITRFVSWYDGNGWVYI